jgi:hypothetical protein
MSSSDKPKPIRRPKVGVRSLWRVPDEGPIIPRLQKKEGIQAIGFTAKLTSDDDE